MSEQYLRKIYSEILLGYSSGILDDQLVFIKHFSSIDQGIVDSKYLELYAEASKCLPVESEKLAELGKEGKWLASDDDWITNHRIFLENLYKTRDHPLNISERGRTIETIKSAEAELNEKLNKKQQLLGLTAESFASRKINDYYVYFSLYKDSLLVERYIPEEDFAEFDDKDLEKVVLFYNSIMGDINGAVKKIALSGSFQSNWGLCDDNVYNFYGLPIARLTYYQTELAIYSRYFKHILNEKDVPFNIRTDPEALINWYQGDKVAAMPAQTEKVLDNLNKEAIKTGGKIKGNLNVMKAMQGLLS